MHGPWPGSSGCTARQQPENVHSQAAVKEKPMRYLMIHWIGEAALDGAESMTREQAISRYVYRKRD
jgi:hypothetical protein